VAGATDARVAKRCYSAGAAPARGSLRGEAAQPTAVRNIAVTIAVAMDPRAPTRPLVAIDPTDPTDAIDPTEPIEAIEPTEPIDVSEPIDATDPADQMLKIDA
jgi:hypothetical protein